MAIDFNQEEYIKQLKIHKRLEELKPKYQNELYLSTLDLVSIKDEIDAKQKRIKELNKFFKRRKNKGEIKSLTAYVENSKFFL